MCIIGIWGLRFVFFEGIFCICGVYSCEICMGWLIDYCKFDKKGFGEVLVVNGIVDFK